MKVALKFEIRVDPQYPNSARWYVSGTVGRTKVAGETSMHVHRHITSADRFEATAHGADYVSRVNRVDGRGAPSDFARCLIGQEFKKVACAWLRGEDGAN